MIVHILMLCMLIILLILCSLFTLYFKPYATHFSELRLPSLMVDRVKYNCSEENIYSFIDAHCTLMCLNNATYSSRNGLCVNVAAFTSEDPKNNCDSSKGVIGKFIGNPLLGKYDIICKSFDSVQDDDTDVKNKMCLNGEIDINYLDHFPQITDCLCAEGTILKTIPPTETMREYAVCVPQELVNGTT